MELLSAATPEDSEKGVVAHLMRHGETNYTQPEITSLDEANDLTLEGEAAVRKYAEELADLIQPDEEVAIWSSPMGRTLHTAKIVAEVLEARGIMLRKKGTASAQGIEVFNSLQEVQNFRWEKFIPLVNGGPMQVGEITFEIDPAKTNPKGLKPEQYFYEDEIKNIPSTVKDEWPPEYVAEIEAFESSVDATKRILHPLSLLQLAKDKPYRVIIVTHDALTSFMANALTDGEKFGVERGEFLNLDLRGEDIIASRVGDGISKNLGNDPFNIPAP
jgi:broad specificity phosphatase PhoE